MNLESACEREADGLLSTLRELVRAESPSTDRGALEACAAVLVRAVGGSRRDRAPAAWRTDGGSRPG